MLLVSEKLCRMFGGRGKFSSAFSETVDHQIFFRGKLMSLFSADEESVPFCLHTAVSNDLSFVSCMFSALLTFSAVLQPSSSGKSWSPLWYPKCNARVGADQSSPAAPTRGRVNRAQQVTAATRNMRKSGHGRRKKSLVDN